MGVFDKKENNENGPGGKRKSINTKKRSSAFSGPIDDENSTVVAETIEAPNQEEVTVHSVSTAKKQDDVAIIIGKKEEDNLFSEDVELNLPIATAQVEANTTNKDLISHEEIRLEDLMAAAIEKTETIKNDIVAVTIVEEKNVKWPKNANRVDPKIELQDVKIVFPEETPCNVICVGCDEAGRGPLIGPVVCAAAIWLPFADTNDLPLCDSKMLTKEETREMVFEKMMITPGLVWASVEISASTIDIINILNASLLGMSLACSAVLKILHSFIPCPSDPSSPGSVVPNVMLPLHDGCDIESGISEGTDHLFNQLFHSNGHSESLRRHFKTRAFKDLPVAMFCDGDKVPRGASQGVAIEFKMTEEAGGHAPARGWLLNQWKHRGVDLKAKSVVKGDATHQSVSSASIIAKVLRDRRMNSIASLCIQPNVNWGIFIPNGEESLSIVDNITPCDEDISNKCEDPYKIRENKGYPTKNQKEFVHSYGASVYHRLSFNPTLDLLKKGELRIPVDLKDRAINLLSELKRRQIFKEGLKRDKKRLRKDNEEENDDPLRKTKLLKGQKTLTSMFSKGP